MTRILTGGLAKDEVAGALRALDLDGFDVEVSNDMDAAVLLRGGRADYYLGTCHTGAGASLGLLLGLLGGAVCHTFGRSVPREDEVAALLRGGTRVFGFGLDQIPGTVPVLARAIAAHRP
ncbi:DUF2620 family protein [Streptomyces sp. AJS327]|uniref:DUF2620 family protein n=1 Tax=Streptomyces sp. AJS327 TaxID=2545265 RepID=UPI0015DE2ADE|nr:DUF2620 family protein [Streptomyces sp. AJS327]MBA0051808.1 DUF2620 family protein [Streptomyces sp. AJS327]